MTNLWFVTAVSLAIIAFAFTALIAREPLDQPCRWRKCGHVMGELTGCEPDETGTLGELVKVIEETKSGAVLHWCGGQ